MATWEDGPEYAPIERPDAFTGPSDATVGLEAPAPPPVAPPAPVERPAFADPAQTLPALADLVPEPPAQRDPNEPFDVASSVMTAESSAWAAAHWSAPKSSAAPPMAPAPAPAPAQPGPVGPPNTLDRRTLSGGAPDWPRTNGAHPATWVPNGQGHSDAPPLPAPNQPPPGFPPPGFPGPTQLSGGPHGPGGQPFPPPGQPPVNGPFPAPGTPQWFAPGSYPAPPQQPIRPDGRAVLAAATPGVLIALAIGGFIWLLAPITVIVAFVLSGRMTYGRRATRTAFAGVLVFLGLVGLLSTITADGIFSVWWDTLAGWACFSSWVLIVAAVVAVYRALREGRPDPPPIPRTSRR